jgi:hypothetical protein
MSLIRTLERLHRAVRAEAKRNPEFAARLDAILQAHASARSGVDAITIDDEADGLPPPAALAVNPVGLLSKEGPDALKDALTAFDEAALRALIAEHNLDPAGVAGGLKGAALAGHILAQAQRRVERDLKLFDY